MREETFISFSLYYSLYVMWLCSEYGGEKRVLNGKLINERRIGLGLIDGYIGRKGWTFFPVGDF